MLSCSPEGTHPLTTSFERWNLQFHLHLHGLMRAKAAAGAAVEEAKTATGASYIAPIDTSCRTLINTIIAPSQTVR